MTMLGKIKFAAIFVAGTAGILWVVNLPYPMIRQPVAQAARRVGNAHRIRVEIQAKISVFLSDFPAVFFLKGLLRLHYPL